MNMGEEEDGEVKEWEACTVSGTGTETWVHRHSERHSLFCHNSMRKRKKKRKKSRK